MQILLFDIDGTLLNTGGAGQAAMESALREEFGVTRPVDGISTAGRTDRAITNELFAFYELPDDDATRLRFIAAYLERLPDHLKRLPGTTLPGVLELLQCLSGRSDTLIGLLTGNVRRGAMAKLTHFTIDHYFPFGGFGDDHHDRCDVAKAALDDLRRYSSGRHEPTSVWVIGDTPHDVTCGRAIGARVLAVSTGIYSVDQLQTSEPDVLLEDMRDVPKVLECFGCA